MFRSFTKAKLSVLIKYGFSGSLRILKSLVITRLFYPKARLIRVPFDIRNSDSISLGTNLTVGYGCRFESYPQNNKKGFTLIFGDNVEINDYVHISAGEKIVIGNNVLIASKVFISDINHGNYVGKNCDSPLSEPKNRQLSTKPVTINDNVWIGESVCILPGVTIGKGSIIGASAVVTKNVPDNSIAIGSPARVIKVYDFNIKQWIPIT